MSRVERIKSARRSAKNRVRRKFRSPWKSSKDGMRGQVKVTRGGITEVITVRKKFYFYAYDANGKHLGTFWFRSTRVPAAIVELYQSTHGVKHPVNLPIRSEDQIQRLKHRAP